MASFIGFGGSGGGGSYAIFNKSNGQPAVFADIAARDAYFTANPSERAAIAGKPYVVGIGTTPEDPDSVTGTSGWFAYNAVGFPAGWQSLLVVLKGNQGQQGTPGTTPSQLIGFVNQAGHGFTAADVAAGVALTPNGSGGYSRASNTSVATTANAILADVTDVNNYTIVLAGYGVSSSHGFTGDVYYLGTNGAVTATRPSAGIVQELFRVVDDDNLSVNIGQPFEEGTTSYTFERLIDAVAEKYSIASGAQFTNEAAAELFSRALGTDVTVRTTNGRVNGTYAQGSPSAIWCNGGNPPTGDGAFLEVIIPANVIEGMDLVLTANRASSTGTRGYWLYDGNPTAGGTHILPVQGNRINTTSERRSVVYDLGTVNGEIHLVVSRVLLCDLQLIPSSIRNNVLVDTGKFSEAFGQLASQSAIGHGASLSLNQVNQCLTGLGVGMSLRQGDGRVVPVLFNSGSSRGVFGGSDNQDETTNNAAVYEFIIPRRNLTHNMSLDLGYLQVSSGGNDRDIRVYAGNPTAGGTRITPKIGSETHSTYSRSIWDLSATPEALGSLNNDIHIVCKRVCLVTFNLFINDITKGQASDIEQLRGGDTPAAFSTTSNYSIGTFVSRNNRIYQAVRTVTAGAWNPSDWQEESVMAHGNEISGLIARSSNHERELNALRGATPYSTFSDTANYPIGSKVHFGQRNYEANQAVSPGSWDASQWDELSVEANSRAIKNLPGGGGGQHPVFSGTVNSNNRWVDLYTWEGSDSASEYSDRVLVEGERSDGTALFGAFLWASGSRTNRDAPQDQYLTVSDRTSNYPTMVNAQYRVIFDTDARNSKIRLQFRCDLDEDLTVTLTDDSPIPPTAEETLGDLAIWTGSGEKVVSFMDVTRWQENDVHNGYTGGIIADNIGDATVKQAWTRYSNQVVEQLAGNTVVQRIGSHGTRFSAGEYGTWGTDSVEPAFPTNALSSVTNNRRPNNDDTTGNPLSTVVCNLSNASTGSALLRWDSVDSLAILRLVGNSSTNRGCLRHRFDGATIGQKIRITHKWWKSSDATLQHTVRLDGPEGPNLKVLTLPSSNPNSAFYTTDVEYTVTVEDAFKGYAEVFLSNTGSGTIGYYLYSYRVDIIVDEPPLQTNVVGQFDSVYRGVLLPRIVPVSSDEHTRGIIALDATGFTNPIFFNGDDWSNFAIVRNETADVQYGTYYSSELGTGALADQGFEQTTGPAAPIVQDYQGFPQLLRLNHNGTLSIFSTIDDTDAFWQAAWDRGLLVTHRVMAADTSRDLHMNIEPRNDSTSWGTGRFTYNITNNSSGDSILELERANGGSANLEVPITKNIMHTISVFVPPTAGVATVLLDGQVIGTAGLGGYNGQRGICTFTVGAAAGDYFLQQYGITIMDATATAKNFTVKEITDSIRYVIPTTANEFVMTMPKALMPVGATFSVINGGSREVTIKGADDDLQLFSGNPIGKIPAGHECTFVQTGFPTGNIWSMSNAVTRRSPVSQGHDLHLRVDASGNIVSRHGTYTASDVTVSNTTTGSYNIAVGGHVFTSTNFSATATVWAGTTAQRRFNATTRLGAIGEVGVHVVNESGAAADAGFSIDIYW